MPLAALTLLGAVALTAAAGCGKSRRHAADGENAAEGTTVASSRGGSLVEAELHLEKIKQNARTFFLADAAYPSGAAPLTPPTPCCQQPGGKCAPGADWSHAVWQALGFQVDEPSVFQYSYEGKADQFLAIAFGDPGCTGRPVKLLLAGTAPGGLPTFTLTRSQ